MPVTEQLKEWSSDFGVAYTDRNAVRWQDRMIAFQAMIGDLQLERVLEVGCNKGHNLIALKRIFPELSTIGIDPNRYAVDMAKQNEDIDALEGNVFNLPFKDRFFDLSFTAGVLIHISLQDLPKALAEIYRVSNRYILAIEYFDLQETEIPYRDHTNLLWKRNFKQHYLTQFPDLSLVREGYWDDQHGFDRSHWWLFERK